MNGLFGKLARRYLIGRKGRTLMTLLGIALGVTMVVAVLLINGAVMASYKNMLAAAAGRADLQVSAATGSGFAEDLLATAEQARGVATAVPVIASGTQAAAGDRQTSATIYGIAPGKDEQIRDYRLTAGRLPQASGETAVTAELARSLDLRAGDQIQLLTTRGMQSFTVTGVFDAGGTVRGAMGPFGVVTLPAAQEAFAKAGKLDLIDLRLTEGADRNGVKAALESALGSQVRVGTPVERSRDMQKLLDGILFVLTMAGAISLFAGAFIIYTNVSMGVAERRRDLSILRALGMRRSEVMRLVLLELGLLGLLGAALGLGWGYGLASAVAGQMTDQFLGTYGLRTAAVAIDGTAVATALVVGIGAALFAAFAPARETVQVSPVEAMRPGEVGGIERERHGWARFLAGLGLVAAAAGFIWATWPAEGMLPPWLLRTWGLMLALMLLGAVVMLPALLPALTRWVLRPLLTTLFGVTGTLAAGNLIRQPRRTAATICALIVSLSYMVGMGGVKLSQTSTFDRWYSKVIGWDLNVSSSFSGLGALVELDPAFERDLAGVEGVRLVSPQKMSRAVLSDGDQAFLQVFDHSRLRQYSETPLETGDWNTAIDQMEQGGHVIISPAVARRLSIGVGDSLTLPSPDGPVALTVAGIMTDVTPYGGTVQLDRQDYLKHWHDETATTMAVLVQPGADPAAVKARIMERWGEAMHLNVQLNREFWAYLRQTYDGFYQLMDGLIWIAVLVSGLAIANTLFASILERRREVGILRALGTRRGEVVRVVAGEALGIGLVGGLFGILAGLGLQAVMVQSSEFINGANVDWVIAWGAIGIALAVAALAAPAVGLLPAHWASRMDVVEALRYE
jgi:putative ABC transport system permease protein